MFEDAYHGEYVKTIAQEFFDIYGAGYEEPSPENLKLFKELGEKWCFAKIKATLNRMSIIQDVYYNENSLYEEGKIDEIIEYFKEHNLAYEKDGALWLKLSELGQDDDRVIVKSSGEPTYRLPDIAYHREKFRRGFDLMIDVFGADHIATVPDVLSGVKALGYDPEKVNVLLHQFVTLTENGQQVKMSKRTGKSYTLDELLDEVGEDVVRFFLLMRGIQTHLEFDLSLAKEQSDKNPVFYLQYAHARISSIFEKLKENEISVENKADLTLLTHQNEINLIKTLMQFEKSIMTAANKFEPHVLADYLRKLASDFHLFYHECRILGIENDLMQARIKLLDITRNALLNGLKILGVSAPERM
jgi:arginyl-tRNA synthetase